MKLDKINNSLLVLPSWYPSEVDPSSGDFIQRHVEAMSLYKNEYVLYVVKDEQGIITKKEKSVVTNKNNFSEEIIYYHPPKTGLKLLDKFISHRNYVRVYKKAIKKYIEDFGLPKLAHVHVAQKAGLLAIWLKRFYSIPFILSEHWTAYLPEADLKISDHSVVFQRWTSQIFKEAELVTVVSNYLGEAIKKLYPFVNFTVIPNVVNKTIINSIHKTENERKTFVHASTQNYQKNTEAILEAFALLKNEPGLLLQLFGPTNENILNKIKSLHIEDKVEVKGNVSQHELFQYIKNSQAVILYSRFETFGCVLIEANALGVPVIVSNLPVFKEIITNGINGIFAGTNAPEKLAKSVKEVLQNATNFDSEIIMDSAKKYSYKNVGKLFEAIIT